MGQLIKALMDNAVKYCVPQGTGGDKAGEDRPQQGQAVGVQPGRTHT